MGQIFLSFGGCCSGATLRYRRWIVKKERLKKKLESQKKKVIIVPHQSKGQKSVFYSNFLGLTPADYFFF